MMKDVSSAPQKLASLVHVMTTTADRNKTMRLIDGEQGDPGGLGAVLAAANLNARQSSDLALAAGKVVAKRVALGVAGALNPSAADHAEFARMVPEKRDAFSAAGAILLKQAENVGRTLTRLVSDEMQATANATMAVLAAGVTPAGLATAQHRFVVAWFARASAGFAAIGMLSLHAQAAAMAPICQQVAVNVDRLSA
jgi:hypothetical protein